MGILVGNQMPEAIINVGSQGAKGQTNTGYFMNAYGNVYESGSNQTNTGGYASDFKKEIHLPNYPSDTYVNYLYACASGVSSGTDVFFLYFISNNPTLYANSNTFMFLDEQAELPFASVCIDGTLYKIENSTSRLVSSVSIFTGDSTMYNYLTFWNAEEGSPSMGETTGVKKELQFKG